MQIDHSAPSCRAIVSTGNGTKRAEGKKGSRGALSIGGQTTLDMGAKAEADIVVDGVVAHVVYANESTAWSVIRINLAGQDETQTAVGPLVGAQPGEHLRLQGRWVQDKRFGRQFRVSTYMPIFPNTVLGIERYLGSGLVPGLGATMAGRIVHHFGLETIGILQNAPERLTEVEGIGKVRMRRISRAWEKHQQARQVMMFLQTHGVSAGYAARIHRRYGERAVAIVRNNPYQLALDVSGIGFRTADAIANSLGIQRESPQRAEAGVLHILTSCSNDGHMFFPWEQLVERTSAELEVDRMLVEQAVDTLQTTQRIVLEPFDTDRAVYLKSLHDVETEAAERVAALVSGASSTPNVDLAKALKRLERTEGLSLAPEQREAISRAIQSKVLLITGGPGTGKTTIVNGILRLLDRSDRTIALCAPTGRAAKRMEETTGHPAQTIHRMLAYSPRTQTFEHNAENPLDVDMVIVDEVSMIDTPLFCQLLRALPLTCHVVLVGDADQLPSVGPGLVLADLIASQAIDVVRLTEVFRQARQSLIVSNAHAVNHGLLPEAPPSDDKALQDFYLIERAAPEALLGTVKELIASRVPRRFGFDPCNDVQVLTPTRRGLLGADNLNTELQTLLNPHGNAITRGERTLRVGDKVMQIRNNYDHDVFNGDLGRIEAVDHEESRLMVRFDDRLVPYELSNLDELSLAYACSIHKSQGSEYPAVIVVLHTQHYIMLRRNLLYTALTRGKKLVVLVGSRRALEVALRNADTTQRYSRLAERLRSELA